MALRKAGRAGVVSTLALALALLAPVRAGQAAEAKPYKPEAKLLRTEGKAELWQVGGERVLFVEGSPREIGRQIGAIYKDELKALLPGLLRLAQMLQGVSADRLHEKWEKADPYIPDWFKEQLKGQAEGSGLSLRDVEIIHSIPIILHCTSAVATGPATKDGRVYVARSLDYFLRMGVTKFVQETSVVTVFKRDGDIPYASITWSGFMGCLTGINAEGLCIGYNSSKLPVKVYDGVPLTVIQAHLISHARTLEEGLDVLRNSKRTQGYNVVIADAKCNDGRIVEVNHAKCRPFAPGEDNEQWRPYWTMPGCVWRANRFVDPELGLIQRDGVYDPRNGQQFSSWLRFNTFGNFLKKHYGRIDARLLLDIHREYPLDWMCLYQVVFSPGDREFYVANAKNPNKHRYPGSQNSEFYHYYLDDLLERKLDRIEVIPAPAGRERGEWPKWGMVSGKSVNPPAAESDAKIAEWIKPFTPAQRSFAWSGYHVRKEDGVEVIQVNFPSPKLLQQYQCNTVWGEYYRPTAAGQKAPCVICLHSMDGRMDVSRGAASALARKGVHALALEMPYYLHRQPEGWTDPLYEFTRPDFLQAFFHQAVADVCRARDWLANQDGVDPLRIGVFGVDVGGAVAALAVGVDGRFGRAAIAMAGGGYAECIKNASGGPAEFYSSGRAMGMSDDNLHEIAARLDPVTYARRARHCATYMVCAEYDEVFPEESCKALWRALGSQEIKWFSQGGEQLRDDYRSWLGDVVRHFDPAAWKRGSNQ